jgi:hypothetical protein
MHTMSALDVSCVSKTALDSSDSRLGARPGSQMDHDKLDGDTDDDDDDEHDEERDEERERGGEHPQHRRAGGKSRDALAVAAERALLKEQQQDPFAMLQCKLYAAGSGGSSSSSSSSDRKVVGSLSVSLGLSDVKALSTSLLSSTTDGGVSTSRGGGGGSGGGGVPSVSMREAADGDYLRAMMSDTPLKHSEGTEHTVQAFCHAEERTGAISRLEELQREQRGASATLRQSLDLRQAVNEQLRPSVARIVNETAGERCVWTKRRLAL